MNAQEIMLKIRNNEQIHVVDVRQKERYDAFHIPGAIWAPKGQMFDHPEKYINKDHKWYVTCNSGNSAGMIAKVLQAQGYDIEPIENGMNSIVK